MDKRYIIISKELGIFYGKNLVRDEYVITVDVVKLHKDFDIKELETIDKIIDLIGIKYESWQFTIETSQTITI